MSVIKANKKINPGLILIISAVVLFACLLLPVVISLGLRGIGGFLIHADPLKKADAVVALSGDSGDRVSEAVLLYKSDYADYLIITFTDEAARDELIRSAVRQSFPQENIFVTGSTVFNTVDEAIAVRRLALEHDIDSLIIITDPYHTLRTRIIFESQLKSSDIDVQVRPVRDHWYRNNTWWKTELGRQYTYEEYLKIILYFFGVF